MTFFKFYESSTTGGAVVPFTAAHFVILGFALIALSLVTLYTVNQNEWRGARFNTLLVWKTGLCLFLSILWIWIFGPRTIITGLPLEPVCLVALCILGSRLAHGKILNPVIYFAGISFGIMDLVFFTSAAPLFTFQTLVRVSLDLLVIAVPLVRVLLGFDAPSRRGFKTAVGFLAVGGCVLYGINHLIGSNYGSIMNAAGNPFLSWVNPLIPYPWGLAIMFGGIVLIWIAMFIFFERAEVRRNSNRISSEYIERRIRIIR